MSKYIAEINKSDPKATVFAIQKALETLKNLKYACSQ